MPRANEPSNGIRFSISDLALPRARLLRCLYRERAAISLFDALSASPPDEPLKFLPEVISKVAQTLARFKSISDDFGVPPEHITVFATEAMRKATNSAAMLDAILSASGLGVHVLAPEVETLFGAVGARSGFGEVDGLFLDLGGGSVQMTYMSSATAGYELAAARSGISLPFGAAKLIKILQAGDIGMRKSSVNELGAGLQDAFANLQQRYPTLHGRATGVDKAGIDIYLCGGGFRGYGHMLMHNDPVQPYPIPAIGAYTVPGALFRDTEAMRKVNETFAGKIFGMSKRRREQFPAISTVVEALVATVPNIRTVTFCSGGNREGALLMRLPREVREAEPLPLLHELGDTSSNAAIQSVLDVLASALPSNHDMSKLSTVLTLGLGPLFVGKIWARLGDPREANAAYELHQAVTWNSSIPGLTHLARAVLGLTLCARWGSSLGPVDQQLHKGLRGLASQQSPEVIYWADYIGAVAAAITTACPVEPKTIEELRKHIR